MGEKVAARLKKQKGGSLLNRYRQGRTTILQRQPDQQGSAVMIAGFTSDQSVGLSSRDLMTDKTSVRRVLTTLHLENLVLSVACRHAIKQQIFPLTDVNIRRAKSLFCNVP